MEKDFILEAENFLSEYECQQYISYFDRADSLGFAKPRNVASHIVSDKSFMNLSVNIDHFEENLSQIFLNKFWEEVYPIYAQKYSIISSSEDHKIYTLKFQKTEIGQAYHVWHYETMSRKTSNLFLTFICYLNTVEDGGETEFLYYPKRVKAEMGKIVLFPGSFTHTHRGNPPITNEKYVITGWVEY